MDLTIRPGPLSGTVAAIPSKSQAHRLLICAALADNPTELICSQINRDIEATAQCLRALGAEIRRTATGYTVSPIKALPTSAVLPCGESGSTLRFLLPIVGALGVEGTFVMEGRLPQRPLSPLWEELERMGCHLSRPAPDRILCRGKLRPGNYQIDGGVSSQYITGLLFALSILGDSHLEITGKIESQPYIRLTQAAMALFSAPNYHSPGTVTVEGDWSNAAFFLSANALGSQINITGLDPASVQGDRQISALLPLENDPVVDASDIPDLIPVLSVVAACKQGATFTNIQRLRAKESDRVKTTVAMLTALGGKAEASDSTLRVYGTGLLGGTVDSANDHRIAMSAAVAATVCAQPVTVLQAQCVEKSYPGFWRDHSLLGGNYEQLLR